MLSHVFPTPEAAAMDGFPASYCRVVAVALDGKDGVVVLDTGPAEYRYLYGGTVERVDGGWRGGIDGNMGTGWTSTDVDRDLGVVMLWAEAPHGADAVRVTWRAEERETPVQNGVYLVTWWREPYPEGEWPRVTAFRVGGRWLPPGDAGAGAPTR